MFKKYFFLVIVLLKFGIIEAQDQQTDTPISNINLIARYQENQSAVELRFVPTTKSVLHFGINHGFIIERAEIKGKILKESDLEYKQLAIVKSYSDSKWSSVMSSANADLKDRYEMARDFYKESQQKRKSNLTDLGAFIKEKKASDLEYAFLVLTAIQHEKVAEALGLGYIDKTVKKNTKYVYQVKIVDYNGPYDIIPVPFMITTVKEADSFRKIDVIETESKLVFSWEESDMISGVLVERKDPKTGKYEQLNKSLKLSLQGNSLRNGFEDKDLTNNQTYEYRFYGYNVFGEKVQFGEAKATPKDRTPPKRPIMLSAEHISENEVQIKWDVSLPADTDLKGFKVKRSPHSEEGFKDITPQLLSKDTRSFIDPNFVRAGKNFYLIEAIDQVGNVSNSFSSYVTLIDSIPPSKPSIALAKMDSTGIVSITIKKNPEKDLMGYRLLMANDPSHEFTAIQDGFELHNQDRSKVQLSFMDTITLRSLSKFVYYKVVALDEHYNQSDLSDSYQLKRIDTIPPTTPIFKNVIVHPDKIELHFVRSLSQDVKQHYLYRKKALNDKWQVLSKLASGTSKYIDKTLSKNVTYYYSLRAQDDSQLYSKYAVAVRGTPYDTGKRNQVTNFKLNKKDKYLELSWSYSEKDANTYFAIYRSNEKGKLVQYKITKELSIKIKEDNKKKRQYAVKVFTKDGGQSKLSKIVS